MEEFDYVKFVTKTYRNSKSIGQNAIVPRYVEETILKNSSILDFGCGKDQPHVLRLRKSGFDIKGFDLSIFSETKDNLNQRYDVVYLSNVINVQPTIDFVRNVLLSCFFLLKKMGYIIKLSKKSKKSRDE